MEPLERDAPGTVGPYRLLGRLGSGGMGRVYLGRSAGGRAVAVKLVHPHLAVGPEFRERFRREIETARRVGAHWTAPVLDADPEAPVPWVATGYVAGPSLAEAVGPDRGLTALPESAVRALGAGLGEALAAVHALDLVHRDVKPSNVLLALDGPRLIDFGIARALDGPVALTSSGVSVGSPGYMAPEQVLGRGAGPAADVFSLAAVLAYAANGAPPFPGNTSAALLYRVVHEPPELGHLDGALRELLARCLHKDPATRPTAAEVTATLAPGGAAELLGAGWLPGSLVEQVGREAVRLLDLDLDLGPDLGPELSPDIDLGPDVAPGPHAGSERVSGVVPFSRVAVPVPGKKDVDGAAPQGAGVFGPPDPSYARDAERGAALRGAPVAPTAAPSDAATGKGGVGLSFTAGTERVGGGRKFSCSLALAVTGALAVVTVGTGLVLHLLPGDSRDGGGSAAGPAPSGRASSGPAGVVPARYVGTWEGPGTALSGTLPMGTFRVRLHQAAVGQELGTMTQTDQLGGVCHVRLVLKSASAGRLVADGKGPASDRAVCTKTSHTVYLRPLADKALEYDSRNKDSGNPVARMTRVP